MLQSIAKRKITSLFRPTESTRIPREDAIFGCVFGLLAYADALTLPLILRCLLPGAVPVEIVPPGLDYIEFWPRLDDEKEGWTEPDAVIDLSGGGKTCRLIIEAKWESPLGVGQAAKQWHTFSTMEATICRHVFVVKHASEVMNHFATDESAVGLPNPYVRTWIEIVRDLKAFPKDSHAAMGRWAEDVCAVLNFFGVKVFEGFDYLCNNFDTEIIVSAPSSSVFYNNQFAWEPIPDIPDLHPIFWSRSAA